MDDVTSEAPLTSNITDTALIWEGGGMRAAYSSGALTTMLTHGLYFDWVAGISAGSSCTCNYLSRDADRARRSFVDLAAHPDFGDLRTFVKGQGLFNAEWIYEQTGLEGQALPFDWGRFTANPARVRIGAVKARTGETVYWGRDDLADLPGLMRRVRASSTMPILMPMPVIDGEPYVDGALGSSGGIALDIAKADGFTKFFVVLTRPRGYRKLPERRPGFYRRYFRDYPAVAEALITRHERYNATLDELDELERQGRAYLFRPVDLRVANAEKRVDRLATAFHSGRIQAAGEVGRWKEFLGLPAGGRPTGQTGR
jgi:predicted patatin/cPLA2 family phospholipase